ncbi:MAG TPA: sigma-70 family RNA polymerase sigma factor, partial [Planctomycetota bacterium]|nr:sigma-70 family RNA polymerase sigma factor [Planctomycetota bacterium]
REHREQRASHEKKDHEPLDTEQRSEMVEAIASAFAGLPAPYRDVLYLRYYEDRSPPEIAERLDYSLATVKTRLSRGMELLRKALEQRARQRGQSLSSLITGLVALQEHAKPASVGLPFLGGALMVKKLVAALVIAGAASWWMWRAQESDAGVVASANMADVALPQALQENSAATTGSSKSVITLPEQDTRMLAEPAIRLHVLDEQRGALSSVKVELVTDREVVFLGSTDLAGRLEMQPPPKSADRIVFSLAGFAVREAPPPKTDQRDLEVVLRRGGTLRGRVVEYNLRVLPAEEMEPIAGARVVAMGQFAGRDAFERLRIGDPSIRSAVTDANGEFTIDGLVDGARYQMRAGAPGWIQNVNEMRATNGGALPIPEVPASDVVLELQHGYAVAWQFVDDASNAVIPFAKSSTILMTSCRDRSARSISSNGIEAFLAGLDPRLSDPDQGLVVSLACTTESRAELLHMNLDANFLGYAIAKVEAAAKPLSELTPIMTVALHQTAAGFGTVALEWVSTNKQRDEMGHRAFDEGQVELVGADGSTILLPVPLKPGVEHLLSRVPVGRYRVSVAANARGFVHPQQGAPPLTIEVEAGKQSTIRVPLEGSGSIELQVERADGTRHDGRLHFQLKRADERGDGNFMSFSAPPYRISPLDPGTYSIKIVSTPFRFDPAWQPAPVVVAAGAESVVRVRFP